MCGVADSPARAVRCAVIGASARTACRASRGPTGRRRARRRSHGHRHGRRGADDRRDRRPQSRAHVLLVVGAGRHRPHRHRPRRGRLAVHARRPKDPRLQQPADVREHRPRRPAGHRRHHRAGDEAAVRPAGVRDRDPGAARREARRDPAGRHRQGLLHARRRRGDRERDQARAPLHGPAQAAGPLSLVPRRDDGGDDADRRPAPPRQRAGAGRRRALPGHAPLGRGGTPSRGGVAPGPRGRHPLRGRPHHRGGLPRDDRGDERHPHPARRLPRRASARSATATAS